MRANTRALREFIDAFNARDLERLRGLADPEIELQSRFASVGGAIYNGHARLADWFEDLRDAWEFLDVEIEEIVEPADDETVALLQLHGRGRESGLRADERVAHRHAWRDGRLLKLEYIDRSDAETIVARARPAVDVATFDCYGTLIDWEGGLGSFLHQLARWRGDPEPGPARPLRERWEAIQFELVRGAYRRYEEVLAESLRLWMEERGLEYRDADGTALVMSMQSWQPFPDTVPALRRARDAGLRLVIISNTDRSIMEHTLQQLEVPFDEVVVAEDVGAYKPSTAPFERALEVIGEPADRIVHVAFGFKYDIGPAQQLGFRTAWVNRHREPRPGTETPDYEWETLWGLPALAESR